jgi:hypothetical protein
MSGHIYGNDFLDWNAEGSKKGKKDKNGKNPGLFAIFCTLCLFCFQTISSTAKPIFEMCPDLSGEPMAAEKNIPEMTLFFFI